jgi:hypothetical protein
MMAEGKRLKKTVFTLDVDNYAPEITRLTFPLMRYFAAKIGAEFHVITERKFPGYPAPYEKLQMYQLGQEMANDWNIFFDADTLVHPELIDFTEFLNKDTVANNGSDMGAIRWIYDRYFRRDGRNIGTCGWCIAASDWCLDLWRPLDDLTYAEALAHCRPTVEEINSGLIDPAHLLDDYVMSRNIARFGLKYTTLNELFKKVGLVDPVFFWHQYTIPEAEKVKRMKETLEQWKLPKSFLTYGE